MNPAQLPEKQYALLKKIRKTYKVDFSPLRLRDQEINLLQITDLEPLLAGRDPFADLADFPLWVKLWEAAMILADLMLALQPLKKGQTLLELGAGLGAPGLAAALAGHQVTLTDYVPHILDFQRVSAAANKITGINFRLFDWLKPSDLPRYDSIIGAEIIFREDFFVPLLNIFRSLLAEQGVIYLAHDARRQSLPKFLSLAEQEYNISTIVRKMRSKDKELTIIVNRLTSRN